MLTEEEQRLYYAVRKAQLNRNTVTKIFEWDPINCKQLISGSFIRVLIKLPLDFQPENYAIACVRGTVEGQPYSGFSTDTRQETNIYLLATLPHTLAEANGTQFQLNSVSNSRMNLDEFSLWLQLSRDEGAPLPSVAELNVIGERIRAYEAAQRSCTGLRPMQLYGNNYGSMGPNSHITISPQSRNRHNDLTHESFQTLRSNAQRQSFVQHQKQSSRMCLPPNLGAHPPSTATSHPNNTINDLYNSNIALSASGPEPSPNANAGDGMHHNGLPSQADGSQIADFTCLTPPSRLAVAAHAMAGGACAEEHTPGASHSYSQLQLSTLQLRPTPQEESEDASLERVLRREIMNNLQQTCLLFPKDTNHYKLSQLRLVERDMIEYLQQVREEISSKQENCVVCMDHVPTVILLPCRHKVMCRLCAPSCGICPVCRSTIKEMFETTEI